eukprot:2355475-Prymnesium_polylepis.1
MEDGRRSRRALVRPRSIPRNSHRALVHGVRIARLPVAHGREEALTVERKRVGPAQEEGVRPLGAAPRGRLSRRLGAHGVR